MKYKQEYDKKRYRRYVFRLNRDYEQDLMEFVESQEYFTQFVKDLIKKEYDKQVKSGKYKPSK